MATDVAGLSVREVRYQASFEQPRHHHEHTTATLVLDGSLDEGVGSVRERALPLSVVFKPAGTEHRNHVGPRGAYTFQLSFESEFLETSGTSVCPLGVGLGTRRVRDASFPRTSHGLALYGRRPARHREPRLRSVGRSVEYRSLQGKRAFSRCRRAFLAPRGRGRDRGHIRLAAAGSRPGSRRRGPPGRPGPGTSSSLRLLDLGSHSGPSSLPRRRPTRTLRRRDDQCRVPCGLCGPKPPYACVQDQDGRHTGSLPQAARRLTARPKRTPRSRRRPATVAAHSLRARFHPFNTGAGRVRTFGADSCLEVRHG